MPKSSELQPIDPSSITSSEQETEASWIVRKLAGSMTGRIVMSSYESFKAAGTFVVCLSPWGDSSPLVLPCIRFRDLAMHMVIAATGGTAAIAAPVMSPMGDAILSTFGDTIIVELGLHAGFDLGVKATNDLFIEHPLKKLIPSNDRRLTTTAIKSLTITLKYKHTTSDAALGFFRSSQHTDPSLFSSIKDYLAIEKGWFSPYLFASGRRPIIPRTMKPDVVFCHGPFLAGDYKIGQTLLNESATVIALCKPPPPPSPEEAGASNPEQPSQSRFHVPSLPHVPSFSSIVNSTTSRFSHSRSASTVPSSTTSRPPSPQSEQSTETLDPAVPSTIPPPRRMVLVVLGIKPHRGLWTTSARPSESIIKYILLNGCPAIIVPVKAGSPLVAWDTLTLEDLHKLNKQPGGVESPKAKGVINVICEYLGLCVDWERVTAVPDEKEKEIIAGVSEEDEQKAEEALLNEKQAAVKEAVRLLVVGAINSAQSEEAKKEIDLDRAGIVMFRIP
ncbi:hypothetical protein BU17DRAFT_97135 [Hysterangium stoloniferum]|nr:hypothetical protein BU17DRAFT_97135 [Hysterangium stoloniferum]